MESTRKNDLSDDEKLMIAILRAAMLYKKDSTSIFRNYGLTFAQYNVLRILEASKNGQNSMSSINKVMLVSGAYMTGITKKLEKDGFLLKKIDSKDERIKLLKITPKGRKTLKKISDEKNNNVKKFLIGCSDYQKRGLLSNLSKIIKNGVSI